MQASNKPVKIKGKGVKSRKVVEQISKPSPMGVRVVPRIDTAMKNKADAAANKLLKAKVSNTNIPIILWGVYLITYFILNCSSVL
jgi:hypothetical protein